MTEPSLLHNRCARCARYDCPHRISSYTLKLDVTYQRAFTASAKPSSVPKGHYELSPEREIFYDMCADHIVDKNDGIDEDEVRKVLLRI